MCRASRLRILLPALFLLVQFIPDGPQAKKRKAQPEAAYTEVELQGALMGYADRFASLAAQAVDDVMRGEAPELTRELVVADLVYSMASVYTIAAEPTPEVALLDAVVVTTLGRMIYEERWRPAYGAVVDPVVTAFRKLEQDIWTLTDQILTKEQRDELQERIDTFRRDNPEVTAFSHLRFADFPSKRKTSSLKVKKSGGMFGSVRQVSQEVERTRLLAERGIYLGTRLPLLAGFFADVWVSYVSRNPAIEQILEDLHTFSEVSTRLADVVEELPEKISEERQLAVDQVFRETSTLTSRMLIDVEERVARVRKHSLDDFLAEEDRLRALVTELRLTLEAADGLLESVSAMRGESGPARSAGAELPAEPFDVTPYRLTIVEATTALRELNALLGSADALLSSPRIEQLNRLVVEAGDQTEEALDAAFWNAVLLIVIALIGIVVAALAYRYLSIRLFGARPV